MWAKIESLPDVNEHFVSFKFPDKSLKITNIISSYLL